MKRNYEMIEWNCFIYELLSASTQLRKWLEWMNADAIHEFHSIPNWAIAAAGMIEWNEIMTGGRGRLR